MKSHHLCSFILALLFASVPGSAQNDSSRIYHGGNWGLLVDVPLNPDYPDAIQPGVLQFACFEKEEDLRSYFVAQGLPFERLLVRDLEEIRCHVLYRPSRPGFRADPDDYPIAELYANVDMLNFITRRDEAVGYALDIIKAVAAQVSRPLVFRIGFPQPFEKEIYETARRRHFPGSRHRVQLEASSGEHGNPWVQDYMKAGRVGSQRVILVTRNLYEGQGSNGPLFRPLLDGLNQPPFVRSHLSWEGGDLQFVFHPKKPGWLLLLLGETAKAYWGAELTLAEFAYVMKLEFGADEVVELGQLTPHVDYFVSLLPADGIALVSEPRTGDLSLAREALELLTNKLGAPAYPELEKIEALLASPRPQSAEFLQALQEAVAAARRAQKDWFIPPDPELLRRLNEYFDRYCQQGSCLENGEFSLRAQRELLEMDPRLLAEWTAAAMEDRTTQPFISSCLAILESQFFPLPEARVRRMQRKAAELEELGFRVIRIPLLGNDPANLVAWSGISYANNLPVDRQLFIPTFGLPKWEKAFLEELGRQLPEGYEVIPVYARHMLLHNGGLHCTFGIVREPPREGQVEQPALSRAKPPRSATHGPGRFPRVLSSGTIGSREAVLEAQLEVEGIAGNEVGIPYRQLFPG